MLRKIVSSQERTVAHGEPRYSTTTTKAKSACHWSLGLHRQKTHMIFRNPSFLGVDIHTFSLISWAIWFLISKLLQWTIWLQ
jgi:hypothetical protein